MNSPSPNPRLQRTRSAPLRSALSRKPLGERPISLLSAKRIVLIVGLLLTFRQFCAAAGCGSPWTITAVAVGPQSVAINLCGHGVACPPSNPRVTVVPPEILVTLTGGNCVCPSHTGDINETVIAEPVTPGNYTVRAIVVDCGVPSEVGRTTFTFSPAAAIPMLNRFGVTVLSVLLAVAGIWWLRR